MSGKVGIDPPVQTERESMGSKIAAGAVELGIATAHGIALSGAEAMESERAGELVSAGSAALGLLGSLVLPNGVARSGAKALQAAGVSDIARRRIGPAIFGHKKKATEDEARKLARSEASSSSSAEGAEAAVAVEARQATVKK